MKLYSMLICLLGGALLYCAESTIVSQKSLDAFLNQVVPKENHKAFALYYKQFLARCKKLSSRQREAAMSDVHAMAKAASQIKEDVVANLIRTNAVMPAKEHKRLLTRYGVYEQFMRDQALQNATMWHKVRCYARAAGRTIAGWFNTLTHGRRVT